LWTRIGRKQRGNERRGAEFSVLVALGEAEDDARGRREQARCHRMGQAPVVIGRGMGHGELALEGGRKQRMEAAVRWPCGIIGAHKPNGIELLPGGFEGAHDLDGRVVGLRSEDGFPGVAFEESDEVVVVISGAVEIEQGHFVEEALPAQEGLVLHGISSARAGPADAIEQERGEIGPGGRLAGTVADLVRFCGAQEIAEMEVKTAQGRESGERIAPGYEGAFRREQTVAALTGVMLGEGKMVCNSIGDESR